MVIEEKCFTIDTNLTGHDHKTSLSLDKLKTMVTYIKSLELALGNGQKETQDTLQKNLEIARRILVAVTDITKGDKYSNDNIKYKRPGNGVRTINDWSYLNRQSDKAYKFDELLD